MARLLATDVQYILNTIPAGTWNEAFARKREMIQFFGGLQPLPRNIGIKDNGVQIPIYYTQNDSFVPTNEATANPTAGHSSKIYYTQPFKRYHGAAGADNLLESIKNYLGFGLDTSGEIMNQMEDLMDAGMSVLDTDLALDGSGSTSKAVQGLLYHVADTGTWNATNKATTTHLQSYIDDNSGTDRSISETLVEGVVDTMRTTRRVRFDVVGAGDEARRAYEDLYKDRIRIRREQTGDAFSVGSDVDGVPLVPLPIDTNYMVFLRRSDWGLYYLPQVSVSSDGLKRSEGPWAVEQVSTGYDSTEFVLRLYVTLVCRNPWAQAGLFDVEKA